MIMHHDRNVMVNFKPTCFVDDAIDFPNTYPLDSDLSVG